MLHCHNFVLTPILSLPLKSAYCDTIIATKSPILSLPLKAAYRNTSIAIICHFIEAWWAPSLDPAWTAIKQMMRWSCNKYCFPHTSLQIYINKYISEYFKLNKTIYVTIQRTTKIWIWRVFCEVSKEIIILLIGSDLSLKQFKLMICIWNTSR